MFSRPYGTQRHFSDLIPSHKWPGYFHPPLRGWSYTLLARRHFTHALKTALPNLNQNLSTKP
jgi:hypothetical protein